MTDVQGFLATVTVDTVDITALLNDVSLGRSKNVMAKPTMDGSGDAIKLVGQKTGTLSVTGQVDTAGHAGLESTWAKDVKVSFSIEMGDGGTIDAGSYAGNVTLSDFQVEAATDDTWNVTLAGDTDSIVYTP